MPLGWTCMRRCCCRRRRDLQESLTLGNGETPGYWTPARSISNCSFTTAQECEEGGQRSFEGVQELRQKLAQVASALLLEVASLNVQQGVATTARGAWHNVGTHGRSKGWVQTERRSRAETRVVLRINTADQVSEFCMIKMSSPVVRFELGGDSVVSSPCVVEGALAVLLELESWPSWFPMCQRADVLQRWSPGEMLVQLDFKLPVIHLHLLVNLYIGAIDRLREDGCLDLVICSANSKFARGVVTQEPGHDGGTRFLDVRLPPVMLPRFQAGIDANADVAMLRISPMSGQGDHQRVQFCLVGEEPCPIDWLPRKIWRMLARNLVSMLERRMSEAPPIPVSPTAARFYRAVEESIAAGRASGRATSEARA
ncbi:unnamed protein product [Prorocentrum cordatum]|uniref:Coenzyme Q-binding protein COQ10 START domain-containing protein n=1 Tax=Prorocentrum cordatum TaxID=2364126 RepID=A0ABN9T7N4_9DINO|nr:unnamed protein product [Polarella glacialis]